MSWLGKLASARRKVSENTKKFLDEDFFEYMPQFQTEITEEVNGKSITKRNSLIPERPLQTFLDMANKNILEQVWNEKWEYACALYTAHYCSMFLKNYAPASQSKDDVSGGGVGGGIQSSTLGDASISYDNSAINNAAQKWGAWAQTLYGQQLVNEARILGIGGAFII